ncbi:MULTISPECIES: hypothetical protein [Saccharothrix]|uniref:hypothetical protein n=1 Tax=Saccharothrix TaxID=2071 RepID=UPI00093A9206|nr:hypothetical protein [Saccharothrix sp. CB00851]OKI39082.1 hypothetical protein A6A25_02555 [Saccharothrix sp. CB00851]
MRILGRLAVAAGATAVILLAAPAANATTSAMDNVPRISPLAAVQKVVGGLLGQATSGLTGGLGGGALGGLGG